jgi:hypothetical protein
MSHEGPLDLVRDHPEIAVELVRGTVGVELPGQMDVSLAPTDMSAVVPVQYLADMVVLISDAGTSEPALAVIIEPQLRDSETKRYSWPVYVATARRVSKCTARRYSWCSAPTRARPRSAGSPSAPGTQASTWCPSSSTPAARQAGTPGTAAART